MAPPNANDEILVPLFDAEALGKPVTVKWSQNLSERTAQYYALTADNITTGMCKNLDLFRVLGDYCLLSCRRAGASIHRR